MPYAYLAVQARLAVDMGRTATVEIVEVKVIARRVEPPLSTR